ncbi:hypothetical protein BJ742DRAFT_883253 [Cladochytrium replicatum]|nr:hypothetical protein BJ742DRAFT_883253 [Cladochytrium replicatum]
MERNWILIIVIALILIGVIVAALTYTALRRRRRRSSGSSGNEDLMAVVRRPTLPAYAPMDGQRSEPAGDETPPYTPPTGFSPLQQTKEIAQAPLPTVLIPVDLAASIPTTAVLSTPSSSVAESSSSNPSNTVRMNILIGSAMVAVFCLALLRSERNVKRTPTLPMYRRREDDQDSGETGDADVPEAMRPSPLPPYESPMDYAAVDSGSQIRQLRNAPSTRMILSTN